MPRLQLILDKRASVAHIVSIATMAYVDANKQPSTRKSPLYHWRKLHESEWPQRRVAEYLGVNRITAHRFENYRRRPSDETASRMASLPGFPLTPEQIRADFDKNVRSR